MPFYGSLNHEETNMVVAIIKNAIMSDPAIQAKNEKVPDEEILRIFNSSKTLKHFARKRACKMLYQLMKDAKQSKYRSYFISSALTKVEMFD